MTTTLKDRIKEKVRDRLPPPNGRHHETNGKANPPAAELFSYYDSAKKTFWAKNFRAEWMELTEGSLRRLLRSQGHRPDAFVDNGLSQVDDQLLKIQHEQDVHFAGPLAGYPVGPHDVCGNRILVTRGPKVIAPRRGPWPTMKSFLRGLLADQWPYFLGWIKSAFKSQSAGPPFAPGQMLALAGPAGCGKSLLQSLVSELLGGRVAKPYRYLVGDTAFNGELFSAEHLAIEDEAASTALHTRRHFGSQLKNLIVNEVQSYHAKGRQALSLAPFWRVSVTLNDEPENLMVLPPLDESLRDKVILLQARKAPLPFSSDDFEGRKRFREKLTSELPGFLYGLRAWPIPEDMRDQRYGVKAWQNPDLVSELENLAPEFRLLALVDTLGLVGEWQSVWEGTAAELERTLREKDRTGEVGRLLTYNTACGVYLGRLRKRFPDRFEVTRGAKNLATWKVKKTS